MRYLLSLMVALLMLTGCAGLTPGGASPSNAGAPMPATNVAQTVRDQAAVPSQSYGGHNYWYFASTGQVAVQSRILDMARDGGWTPAQIQDALAATNGAPETVTISVGGNVNGGNADASGAGNGGGVADDGATVTR